MSSRLKPRLERRTIAVLIAVIAAVAAVPALASTVQRADDRSVTVATSSDPGAGEPVVGAGTQITAAPAPARAAPTPAAAAQGERVAEEPTPTITGIASWYGPGFAGRTTASGEVYDPSEMVAAHKSLPFGTRIRVTNQRNGRSAVLRIVDRGPYAGGRILDVSSAAADVLGMKGSGTAPVSIEIL